MSIRSINQASVTMNQLQQQMDMIGNNMSNSSTTGFKSKQAEFSSLLFQQLNNMTHPENEVGRVTPGGVRVGTGARLGAINMNAALGSLHNTGRDLDIALLNEHHFFEIGYPEEGNNLRFTRDGSFYVQPINNDTQLELVTKDGHQVLGSDGEPIRFASGNIDSIDIQRDGTIIVKRNQQNEQVGVISVVAIENPRILESDRANYYRLPSMDDADVGYADVVQAVFPNEELVQARTLEMSNVDIGQEITSLINAQRSYQFNARTISMADEMQGLINQVR